MVDPDFWRQLAARFRACDWLNAEWNANSSGSGGHWQFNAGIGAAGEPFIDAFKLAARLGAVALSAPDTADAYVIWLDRLVSTSSDVPHFKRHGMVAHIDELLALFCEQLETAALIAALSAQPSCPLLLETSTPDARAAWLRTTLDAHDWTKYRLAELSGVDRKTIQKVFDAKPVQRRVLVKLASTLSPSAPAR